MVCNWQASKVSTQFTIDQLLFHWQDNYLVTIICLNELESCQLQSTDTQNYCSKANQQDIMLIQSFLALSKSLQVKFDGKLWQFRCLSMCLCRFFLMLWKFCFVRVGTSPFNRNQSFFILPPHVLCTNIFSFFYFCHKFDSVKQLLVIPLVYHFNWQI